MSKTCELYKKVIFPLYTPQSRAEGNIALGGSEWSASVPAMSLSSKPHALIEQEVGWAPELISTFCRRKKFLTPPGIRTQNRPASIPTDSKLQLGISDALLLRAAKYAHIGITNTFAYPSG
jgi:hypothetical protein